MTHGPRRALLAAMLATPGAVRAESASAPIGTARMQADGTIILDLMARQDGTIGHGRLIYPPDHPDYEMILRHLGGLRPGESKPVPPFP